METTSEKNTNSIATSESRISFPVKRIITIVIVLLLDIFAIYLMISFGKANNEEELGKLGYETIKLSIQLFLIVLVGGIFIQEYNRARARKDAVNEFRRTFLRDLLRIYSDVKGARRILRAKCESRTDGKTTIAEDCIPITIYHEHISTINANQLELEIMVRELKIIKGVFKNTVVLIDFIKGMERYLNKVISEYETIVKAHRGATSIPLSEVPRLKALVVKGEGSDFLEFSSRYHEALIIIQEERVKVL
ncbi:MAG TPA: hypothetical protein VF648_02400 [Pyrinomonadaceae bacterium]|jgi:hypothetical protein